MKSRQQRRGVVTLWDLLVIVGFAMAITGGVAAAKKGGVAAHALGFLVGLLLGSCQVWIMWWKVPHIVSPQTRFLPSLYGAAFLWPIVGSILSGWITSQLLGRFIGG